MDGSDSWTYKKYSHERRAAEDPAPEFAKNARVQLSLGEGKSRAGENRNFMITKFPTSAIGETGGRANDYEVQLEHRRDAIVRVLSTRRVFSPRSSFGYEKDVGPVVCNFPIEDIPVKEWIRFAVRPVNSFERKGEPIYTEWFRFDGKSIPKNLA